MAITWTSPIFATLWKEPWPFIPTRDRDPRGAGRNSAAHCICGSQEATQKCPESSGITPARQNFIHHKAGSELCACPALPSPGTAPASRARKADGVKKALPKVLFPSSSGLVPRICTRTLNFPFSLQSPARSPGSRSPSSRQRGSDYWQPPPSTPQLCGTEGSRICHLLLLLSFSWGILVQGCGSKQFQGFVAKCQSSLSFLLPTLLFVRWKGTGMEGEIFPAQTAPNSPEDRQAGVRSGLK